MHFLKIRVFIHKKLKSAACFYILSPVTSMLLSKISCNQMPFYFTCLLKLEFTRV